MTKPRDPSLASMGFQSPCLIWLVKAFVRRWKFLTHHTKKSSMERSLRSPPPGGESLIVDIDTAERRPTRVRFRAWGDGRIWLRACQRGTVGWAFLVAARGKLKLLEPSEVVRRFETTLHLVHGGTRPKDAVEQILKVWKEAELELETWRAA